VGKVRTSGSHRLGETHHRGLSQEAEAAIIWSLDQLRGRVRVAWWPHKTSEIQWLG
jgi:hypothetical protein